MKYHVTPLNKIRQNADGQKVIFVFGLFNVLHIGHLRMLEYAKSLNGYLVVGLYDDGYEGVRETLEERSKYLSMFSIIDDVIAIGKDANKTIALLKPEIVVKGAEFVDRNNEEEEAINVYGGKLYFSSGSGFRTGLSVEQGSNEFNLNVPLDFTRRHAITSDVKKYLKDFSKLKIAVIGDTIIDEYINCSPIGMSREDPTIVVSPFEIKQFVGGAAIAAAHMSNLGAKVDFYSLSGNDQFYDMVDAFTEKHFFDAIIIKDEGRRTTVKQRYRSSGKTLLRVNTLDAHEIRTEYAKQFLDRIKSRIDDYDMFVLFDFNYGVLSKYLVESLIRLGSENKIFIAADSQSSSQVGNISLFRNADLITPTEYEARLTSTSQNQSLSVLADEMYEKMNVKNIIITLGSEGVFIQKPETEVAENEVRTDQMPALCANPLDVAGAGDVFLSISAMVMCLGGSVWEASYIGSIAAGIQVQRLGNVPISSDEIIERIIL